MTLSWGFLIQNPDFTFVLLILNILLVIQFSAKLNLLLNRHLLEARGGRNLKNPALRKFTDGFGKYLKKYKKNYIGSKIFSTSEITVKKCGHKGLAAVSIYLSIQYALPVILFVFALPGNYPNISNPFFIMIFVFVSVKIGVMSLKKEMSKCFKKSAYKIYRYLHNQVTSGVSITDAVKTVYLVAGNDKLRAPLLDLSARYARTLDINTTLEEFSSNFDLQEVNSLCTALKQGILTGDTRDLLARQEQIMFKQYFNYIQSETELCKVKGAAVIIMLSLIIIIMIVVPMFIDVDFAMKSIFSN
jgi:hypothetical protein